MAIEDTLAQRLLQISEPRTIAKGDYICHEGQMGDEMYIVLSGSVGVYINSLLEDTIKVSTVDAGNFFGEMSMLDKSPRSASCVAEEDTVCIAISEANLFRLISTCPEITRQLLVNLSERIRDLNDKLFKSQAEKAPFAFQPFALPKEHRPHYITERTGFSNFLETKRTICPVCKKHIAMYNIKFSSLECTRVTREMRSIYQGIDVLWHCIWACPECGYTNFYSEFYNNYHATEGEMLRVISSQKYSRKRELNAGSAFDELLFGYYAAIHLNECFSGGSKLLLGKLWISLYWLYCDAEDEAMIPYCRDKALGFYRATYEKNVAQLPTDGKRQKCAMIIAELYASGGDYKEAMRFFNEVVQYSGQTLEVKALDRIYELRDLLEK